MRFVNNNTVALGLVLLAGFLVYNKIQGWGWVVFGAILVTSTYKKDQPLNKGSHRNVFQHNCCSTFLVSFEL